MVKNFLYLKVILRSNRTFMELKYASLQQAKNGHEVLIVPLWN